MAGRIHLLPDGVINQIAAGEVVERPASVLKELLENAVDAGGGRIDASVSGPFPFTVRVSDEGCGMTGGEVETAVRRHTTSKISAASDLERIGTYGFRGEALPSIASVSRLRILSRPPGEPHGTEMVVEGGAVKALGEAGAPPGTTVEVSELFGNVPARRKFLKSPRTEMARLWDVFHQVAIPCEGTAFRMTDGRGEASYEARESRLERARRHAEDDAKYLVPVDCTSPFFRITGWAGLPQLSRFGSSGLFFAVNGRHFRDRGLFAALREAYRGILPSDRQSVAYLFIECSPSEVDVNVHPAKTEVRFRYARELYELVRHALGEALGERPAVPVPASVPVSPGPEERFFPGPRRPPAPIPDLFGEPASSPAPGLADNSVAPRTGFTALKPVGQIMGTYLVCEGAGEMVIVDQHAADERIVFSRLKDQFLGERAAVQQWLLPQLVTLPGTAGTERAEVAAFLSRAGIAFEPCGEDGFRLTGGPAILGPFDAGRWWKDLCDFLQSQGSAPKGIFDADRELWRMACHASLRAGDALDVEGARALLRELDRAVASHSCPHGRPVWVRFSGPELRKMFGRT